MRGAASIFLLAGLHLGGPIAAAEPPDVPPGLGQLVVIDPQTRLPVRLNLARCHINVVLHPPVALVQIDQSFYNPYPRQLDGTFAFNLPDGGSVSRFAIYTAPGQVVEGEVVERSRVANIAQSNGDPLGDQATADQLGHNLFRMRVWPIVPRDMKRILFDFTLPIPEDDDGWYAFELPVTCDLEPIWDFAITGTIRGPNVPGTARSQSHPGMRFGTAADGAIQFELPRRSYRPDGTFRLRFQQRATGEVTVRSFVGRKREEAKPPAAAGDNEKKSADATDKGDENANVASGDPQCEFLAAISPTVLKANAPLRDDAPSPADVLVLVDTSGGTSHHTSVRQIVRKVASSLRKQDRFRLGCIDVDFRALTKDWVAPQSADAEKALNDLDQEFLLGETDFVESFSSALKSLPPAEKGRRQMILYVGDGALPQGHALPDEMAKLQAFLRAGQGVPISSVLVGNDLPARLLMDRLARLTGGRRFQVAGEGQSEKLTEWVSAGCFAPPRIVSVKAEGVADGDLFVPAEWVPGRALQILGRRKSAGSMKLEVAIEQDGKTTARNWTLALKEGAEDLFVGRLWGQCMLDQLCSEETAPKADQERQKLMPAILALSQEWTLLSPHTALLVMEKEDDYLKYGASPDARHVYWKPANSAALPQLPPEAIVPLNAAPHAAAAPGSREFNRALAFARRAIKNKNVNRALAALDAAAGSPLAATSDEFKSLKASAESLAAQAELLRNLGPQRGWFERLPAGAFETPTTDFVLQLLYGYGSASRDGEPARAALAKRVAPPKGEIDLEEFLKWCGETAGLDLVIDKATLADEGVAINQPVAFRGIRSMSLRSLLRHTLAPVQLEYLFEDGIFKVTTSAKAGEKLSTTLYPVTDLIQSTRSTDYSLLVNPDLDRELFSNRRLNEKLDRKLAVNFADTPFEEIIDQIGEQLDDNVVLDRSTLTDEGVAVDQPVTLQLRDKSVRSVLAQICEPLQLTCVIENEAIVVTTAAKAGEKLQTRIHSGQGLVFDLPPGVKPQLRAMLPNAAPGIPNFAVGNAINTGSGPARESPIAAVSQSAPEEDGRHPEMAALEDPDETSDFGPGAGWLNALDGSFLGGKKYQSFARRRSVIGASETMHLVTSTIEPDSWEELSGPGSIGYFPGAVGFVVRQTQPVHEEIGKLFERLRGLPSAFDQKAGYSPARVPDVGPNDIDDWDVRRLVSLLTSTIQPDSWEDLSGPGAIQLYVPKLVFSIRQTQEVHQEIRNVLTAMRRARYLARRGKSWKSFDIAEGPWFTAALGVTDIPIGVRQSELPEPEADELKALAVLADPPAGDQIWRAVHTDGREPETTVLRQSAARSEFEFDGRVIRVEGDEAAVAYPAITLVERGPWGEAMRRIVDGRLPWLPHRSRRELARLFVVTIVSQNAQSVQLRLELPGAAPGNDVLLTVGRNDGLLLLWESRLDGAPVLRLKFSERTEAGGKPYWKKVIAEDAVGRELERWELVGSGAAKSDLPPLDRGWTDDIVLDLRDQEQRATPPVIRMFQGLRLNDWGSVDRALEAALKSQPDQPFLLLVKAWSLAQRENGREAEVVDLLKQIARAGATGLLRPLGGRTFAALSDSDLYELLLEQPVARRQPADWDTLSRFATLAGKPGEASAHLKAAIDRAGPSGDDPERELRLVQLLLETRRTGEAVGIARARADRHDARPEDVASLAEALHQWGAVSEAAKLMREALASGEMTGERRQKLLLRRASLETGLTRWRTLLEAVESARPDSMERAAPIHAILSDLTDAAQSEQAGQLGDEAKDKSAQAAFRLRQAELYLLRSNVDAAADIAWKLYESKELPADRFEWLCGRLYAARQDTRLIRVVESRLRAGKPVDQNVLDSLATAYDAQGDASAARRARTNARDLKPSPARAPAANGAIGFGGGMFDVP